MKRTREFQIVTRAVKEMTECLTEMGGEGLLGKWLDFRKKKKAKKQTLPVCSFAEGIGWLAVLWRLPGPKQRCPDQSGKSQRELLPIHLGFHSSC